MKLKYLTMALMMLPVACAPAHAQPNTGDVIISSPSYNIMTEVDTPIEELLILLWQYENRTSVTGSVNIGNGITIGVSKKKGCRPAPAGMKGWFCD